MPPSAYSTPRLWHASADPRWAAWAKHSSIWFESIAKPGPVNVNTYRLVFFLVTNSDKVGQRVLDFASINQGQAPRISLSAYIAVGT